MPKVTTVTCDVCGNMVTDEKNSLANTAILTTRYPIVCSFCIARVEHFVTKIKTESENQRRGLSEYKQDQVRLDLESGYTES